MCRQPRGHRPAAARGARAGATASPRTPCARGSPTSRPSSRCSRRSRPRSRRRPRRRRRTHGCPTSTAPTSRWSRSTRPARWTSTRRCTSPATATATCCPTRSPTSRRSSPPGDPVDVEANTARPDAVRRRLEGAAAPEGALRGRGVAAARPGPAGAALDDQARRGRLAHRRARWSAPGCARRRRLSYEEAQQEIDDGTADESRCSCSRSSASSGSTREAARGGISLPTLEQEVHVEDDRFSLEFRDMLPVESWNAQMSLLTGFAAASLMVYARVGLLRTLPEPDHRDVQRLHRTARALGIDWPAELLYADLIRDLDPTEPDQAALIVASTRLLRGSGYVAFDGETPGRAAARRAGRGVRPRHRAAAPARRPLRLRGLRRAVRRRRGARLGARRAARAAEDDAADRTAGRPLRADGARPGRGRGAAAAGSARASTASSSPSTSRSPTRGTVTVREPAVEAPVVSASPLPLGTEAQVRLTTADVTARKVEFTLE